ncbi:sensor histidine kinase [Streptomyces sp. NPDC050560]|uniref:sensor histidine kinase n=1 Tax=Streptomyces sp. NPDC050560 TaxID=3365630 RepID=UPI0037A08BE1
MGVFAGAGYRRQRVARFFGVSIWLVYCTAPVQYLIGGDHSALVVTLGWAGLVCFVAIYLSLLFWFTGRPVARPVMWGMLGALVALSLALILSLGDAWLVLLVYVCAAVGSVLPLRMARFAVVVVVLATTALSALYGAFHRNLILPAALAGLAMTGVRHLVLTTIELRRARAEVAELAANEERMRMARDLHDLLGHSLSLITLKSELAGRMLPERPEGAAQQVADIEKVSRQAMVDVRAAVTGFRRPRLGGELAAAKAALAAAEIASEVPAMAADDVQGFTLPSGLGEEAESALAWTLREAVTNVVRHSGARSCTVTLAGQQTLDGAFLALTVADDGNGGTAVPGNGLTGMRERLAPVGGTVAFSAGRRGGFTLRARVPLAAAPAVRSAP